VSLVSTVGDTVRSNDAAAQQLPFTDTPQEALLTVCGRLRELLHRQSHRWRPGRVADGTYEVLAG
jgi:hypothetical protein